ncbi:Hypothetical predicted protein [Pelobates cultripes]|uniref:Uncharacterized protein n=1 Tax=Pelobates cultripes TaxID=61616 RepID=A0AAD1R4X7_PELCU|nr:Hypothetical predicted protein [Pelobates cultripes]
MKILWVASFTTTLKIECGIRYVSGAASGVAFRLPLVSRESFLTGTSEPWEREIRRLQLSVKSKDRYMPSLLSHLIPFRVLNGSDHANPRFLWGGCLETLRQHGSVVHYSKPAAPGQKGGELFLFKCLIGQYLFPHLL